MESDDLENLEEELYSKIYHDSNSPNIETADFIIDSSMRKSASKSRYYQENNNKNSIKHKQTPRFIKPRKFQNLTKFSNRPDETKQSENVIIPKVFVPYSSVLSSSTLANNSNVKIDTLNDFIVVDNQSEIIIKNDQKSAINSNEKEITLKDEKVFTSPSKKVMKLSKKAKVEQQRQQKSTTELIEILSSDDDNSVIYIENPAPPLIAVESSSDDDGIKKQQKTNKKGGGSPSTSSIISDEFIVRSDKSRLKNIFYKKSIGSNLVINPTALQMNDEDTSNDSIYNTKLIAMNRRFQGNLNPVRLSSKLRSRESSDEEYTGIINMRNYESSKDSSILSLQRDKRLRYDKSNYNEVEFSTLITNAIEQKKKESNKNLEKPNRRRNSTSKNESREIGDENIARNCDLILNINSGNNDESLNENLDIIAVKNDDSKIEGVEFENAESPLDCEIGWNDEMKYFYNEYSYGRDFSLTSVRSFMSSDNWMINNVDRALVIDHNARKIRCRNCNEVGHKSFQCYRPKKKIVCFMCGEVGHFETRCPNALCLRCGKSLSQFSTMCNNCAKFAKKRCPLCKNAFHDLDQCPDKWRRYHSTTSENNDVLNIECKRNDRVYCSICAKQGHFADNCVYFNKQKDGYITSNWFAISNKPSYSSNCKFEIKIQNQHVFQLMTYMEKYFFNLKIPSNCQFYPRFKQRFLEEKYGVTNDMIEYNNDDSDKQQKENFEIREQNECFQSRVQDEHFKTPDDIETLQNDISEAKILVSNSQHTKILKFQRNEVESLGDKFNIAIKFPEHTDQKHLFILGTIANQNSFHKELRELFFKYELLRHQEIIESSTQLPKTIGKVVDRIKNNLQMIKHIGIRETKRTLESFLKSQRDYDCKNVVKFRRSLNITFMGYGELREGASHLRELKKILVLLEKQVDDGNGNNIIDQNTKNKLWIHLKYIFSPIDHGNYLQLFRSYKQVVMQKNLKNAKNS